MPFVVELGGVLVEKDGLSLLERHAVLFPVLPIFAGIPFEPKESHML
jgi:hypothetical protein